MIKKGEKMSNKILVYLIANLNKAIIFKMN